MVTIEIIPEPSHHGTTYRARHGQWQAVGSTPGEALDALERMMAAGQGDTLVIVQRFQPDQFFTAAQRARLMELMDKWRAARDACQTLPPDEQAELEALIEAEYSGSEERAAAILKELRS